MNKRKRHAIKTEKTEKLKTEKLKTEKLIAFVITIVLGIAGCIVNFFRGKAISDGNMFVIFGPSMLIGTIFAVLIIWGLIKGKR
jgi:hypothetical protein